MTEKLRLYGSIWIAIFLAFMAVNSHAATTESAVKAGFVYNFTKFVDWPVSTRMYANFNLCVIGESGLKDSLQAIEGKIADGRPIHLYVNVKASSLKNCQLVFLAEEDKQVISDILQEIRYAPVLTVSDVPGFVQQGGMIGLVRDGTRLAFEINLASARAAGLHVNAQLLKLAKTVKGRK